MSQFDQSLVRYYIMRSVAVFMPDISVSAREGNNNGHNYVLAHMQAQQQLPQLILTNHSTEQ